MKEKIMKYGKFIILGIIIIVSSILVYNKTSKEQTNDISLLEPPKEELIEIKQSQEEIKKIKVDIKGEVNTPGVYELSIGDRVSDAIKISGGLTENADTTLINLSKNLTDEMVIIIYNKYEIEKIKQDLTTTKTVIEHIEKECSCPDTINDACIKENTISNVQDTTTNTKEPSKDNKISINKATLEELQTIPGIGESKAKAIIKYREENNGFESIEEITNVSGIGTSTFEKFKDYITI